MIVATFGQVRFAYYLAVTVALTRRLIRVTRLLRALDEPSERIAVIRALATCVMVCLIDRAWRADPLAPSAMRASALNSQLVRCA